MPLPSSLLKTATGHPMLVELKNGDTYNGRLVSVNMFMNICLEDVICTSKDGETFWKIPETYIRGNSIKYLRIPDEVLGMVPTYSGGGRGMGRGGRGRGRGRFSSSHEEGRGRGRGGGSGRFSGRGRGEGGRGRGRGRGGGSGRFSGRGRGEGGRGEGGGGSGEKRSGPPPEKLD
jgi:U6 snRNA-associated Sm-like protein LSm4